MASPGVEEGAVCTECGYDLRGTQSRKCPECGATSRRSKTHKTVRKALDHAREAASIIGYLRWTTILTIFVWGGGICLPAAGEFVWLMVALVSFSRLTAIWQLGNCETCKGDLGGSDWNLLRYLVWVEAAVALVGGLGVFTGSAVGITKFGTVVLVLLPRIVWVALIGLNTFLVAKVARRLIRIYDWYSPDPWVGVVMFGSLVAPPLMILGIVGSISSILAPAKIEAWVINVMQMMALAGCAFGIAGIIATVILLSMASRAALARAADEDSPRW